MRRPSSRNGRSPPQGAATQRQRCAIYTRKSTEHNLDLAFNSLDAQREACEAYVKSQAHEGWTPMCERYDDGGLSGASLERPALQGLLDQVRAGHVDIIVVYKVDRLTRSLADFAKLVELFDGHGVSFVSVTQAFNTTSSMGRLTLNVLLSFAQFEREVIGERVRDKIAASKRKGLWVGGPVPLGYRSENKALVIVPDEAERVRNIFASYLRVSSVGELAASLHAEGIRPKPRQLVNGRIVVVERYGVGALAHLLKNRFYIGDVVYQGEIHAGTHEAILDGDLFEAVQAKLRDGTVSRRHARASSCALLTGLLFDDAGNPMSPSHSSKQGVRYRYYVSQALLQNRKADAGSVARASAPDIEKLVVDAVLGQGDRGTGFDAAGASEPDEAESTGSQPTGPGGFTADAGSSFPRDLRAQLLRRIKRVTLRRGSIKIVLHAPVTQSDGADDMPSLSPQMHGRHHAIEQSDETDLAADVPTIILDWTPPLATARKGIAHAPQDKGLDPASREALLIAIARARSWIGDLVHGRVACLADIAVRENKVERYVRRLMTLAFLSPKIVTAIADGRIGTSTTISSLTANLPQLWSEQERMFGIA